MPEEASSLQLDLLTFTIHDLRSFTSLNEVVWNDQMANDLNRPRLLTMVQHAYRSEDPRMLSIQAGEVLEILGQKQGWYIAINQVNSKGYVPPTFCTPLKCDVKGGALKGAPPPPEKSSNKPPPPPKRRVAAGNCNTSTLREDPPKRNVSLIVSDFESSGMIQCRCCNTVQSYRNVVCFDCGNDLYDCPGFLSNAASPPPYSPPSSGFGCW